MSFVAPITSTHALLAEASIVAPSGSSDPLPHVTDIFRIFHDPATFWGTVSAGLFLVLVVVIRKHLEKAGGLLLDELGRFGKGRLAERRFLKEYKRHVKATHQFLRVIVLGAMNVARPLLEEVFISLRVSARGFDRGLRESGESAGVAFEAAIRDFPRLVILGAPGAGKTTSLSYVCMQFVQGKLASRFGFHPSLLPIYVPLRRISNINRSIVDDILATDTQILPEDVLRKIPKEYLERQLRHGRCILLLDGLDEVIDQQTHQLVADKINRLLEDYPEARIVVTCRIAGWRNLISGFTILEAQDFSRAEVHRFIFGWNRAVITAEEKGQLFIDYRDEQEREDAWKKEKPNVQELIESNSRHLVGTIEGNLRLLMIARNPMLLSLMCLVHHRRATLPLERASLYEKCIELLVDAWDRLKGIGLTFPASISEFHRNGIIREIAATFQLSGKSEIPRSGVEEAINNASERFGLQIPASELLKSLERTGLLVERSLDMFSFSHLTLQEYLTAKHIKETNTFEKLRENFDNQEWREVTLLYAGLIEDVSNLVREIIYMETPARWMLAAYILGEANSCDPNLTKDILSHARAAVYDAEVDKDILVSVLAALCVDYVDIARRPEQELSAILIEYIAEKNQRASIAMRSLALARITKALPTLVREFMSSESLDAELAAAIILFGNVALPHIESIVRDKCVPESSEFPHSSRRAIKRAIQLFQEIDTAEAARMLLNFYDLCDSSIDDQRSVTLVLHLDFAIEISIALSNLLEDEVIESDLCNLKENELPRNFPKPVRFEQLLWPYPVASLAFQRLVLKIRDDLSSDIKTLGSSCQLISNGTKILFPAIISFILQQKMVVPAPHLRSIGFDAIEHHDVIALNRIQREIKSIYPDKNSFKKLATPNLKENSFSGTMMSHTHYSAVVLINLFFISDAILTGFLIFIMGYNFWHKDVVPFYLVGYLFLGLCRFVICSLIGMRIAGRERWLSGLIFPLPRILQRTPYLTRLHPWGNFALVQGVILLFSVTAVMVFWADDWQKSVFWSGFAAPFVLSSFLYYKFTVLEQNAVVALILRHPSGRKLAAKFSNGLF